MFNSIYRIPRRIRIFILFIIIIFLAYFIVRLITPPSKNIPSDFLKAREEASLMAKNIVVISGKTAENINKISDFDKKGEYAEALNLISEELNNNNQARSQAVNLSVQLEIMAKNLANISPASMGQIALQAISSETALINRLITYNDYLIKLLEVLQKKILGQGGNSGQISELIGKINEEAKIINDLDKNFNQLMGELDKYSSPALKAS